MNRFRGERWSAALILCGVLAIGCGPRPIVGGTRGSLRGGEQPLGEVQVSVFASEQGVWTLIGSAITTDDGGFALVTPGAQGPLQLPAGEYRCTLESAGAPIRIPPEYLQPETTPLRVVRSDDAAPLELATPPLPVTR